MIWSMLGRKGYGHTTELCAKELSRIVVADMERMAPVLLYRLEKIFSPGFFNPMHHLILHKLETVIIRL